MTIFLMFSDEQEAVENLADFRQEDQWMTHHEGNNIDVIGIIYKPDGTTSTTEDGIKVNNMTPIPGFHVNFIGSLPTSLAEFQVFPKTPTRIFA